jgi:hypothetical protein
MVRTHALSRAGLLVGLLVLLGAAWALLRQPLPSSAAQAGCTCELERARSGWCAACRVGYVAERRIESRELYDALDAHGHDIDAPSLECATCRAAAQTDGFCEPHLRGFVGGRAYLSRLAYHLARNESALVPRELEILDQAIATTQRCELCAAAMVIDGYCPKCRLTYKCGRAL